MSHCKALIKGDDNSIEILIPHDSKQCDCSAIATNKRCSLDDSELIVVPTIETEACECLVVDKMHAIFGRMPCFANTYSVVATTIIVILLLVYLVKTVADQSSQDAQYLLRTQNFNALHFRNGLSASGEPIKAPKDWKFIEELGSKENIIHFTVGAKQDTISKKYFQIGYLTASINDGALRVAGKPKFCHESSNGTPTKLFFKNVSHLHLSDMKDCSNYVKLILTEWNFPNVHSIKLHKMIIREKDFAGLTNFIDRHNETLHKVEIDESYICPSPGCDAGMIDFPEHDFKITITRRQEVERLV